MQYEKISNDTDVQARYEKMRSEGMDCKLAELLALRQPPKHRDTYSPMHPRAGRGHGGTNR